MSDTRLSRRQMCAMMAAGPAAMGLMSSAASATGSPKKIGKVLMPIGDATEAMDTLYPFFRLAEEGYEVVVAGPEARLYNMVLHEVPPNADVPWDLTQETKGYHIEAKIALEVNAETCE